MNRTPLEAAAAYGLTVETGGDEFPVSSARPELSWRLPSALSAQTGFDLEAHCDGQTMTFAGTGSDHRFVSWPWPDLSSGASVSWRVRLYGPHGRTGWSEWSAFEAGLFEPDWIARWISPPIGRDLPVGERPAYVLSTTFTLTEPPPVARLYSSALGLAETFVNGVRAGRVELAPGTESYDRTLYAQAADVTGSLRAGTNTIEIVLTDGWYRGRAGAFRQPAAWGTETAARAELRAGPDVIVATDLTWQVRDSPIVQADLMDGQTTNLLHQPTDVGRPVPGPAGIPPLTWSPAPPVRVVENLTPTVVTARTPKICIVDFGQNASGRVRLSRLGPRGARTTIDFGEHLGPDGDLTLDHLGVAAPDGTFATFRQRDVVISDGDPHSVFEPHHTVHGFRYVRIERDTGLSLEPGDITMQVMHTDFDRVGGFGCSDPDLTRLYEAADWSFRGNAVDIPTDCPTRERAGWTGDWQIFVPTAVRLFDVDGFSRKWLQSVRDDQLDDGRIVNISPDNARLRTNPDAMLDMATGSAGWGDAIVLVPWELYRTYGDRRVLEDNWEAMTRWVSFALRAAAEQRHPTRIERSPQPLAHEQYIWDGTFHFGEWCEPTPLAEDGTPTSTMPDPLAWAMADKGEVGTAYLYRSTRTLAHVADVLGRHDEAHRYAAIAQHARAAWQREFLRDDGQTSVGTQASYVRALAFDLVPEHLRARAADHLVAEIRRAGTHLTTGFLATADLLPVLADTGHADVAEQLLRQRGNPSWLGMIDRGATTIWEEWEGIDRNGNAHASLNHYSKGAVIHYLQTHILGLRQAGQSSGWESFVVEPVIPTGMTWAAGHFDSPQGRIEIEWHLDGDERTLDVSVPGGSIATLLWDGAAVDVGPGRHRIGALLPVPTHR